MVCISLFMKVKSKPNLRTVAGMGSLWGAQEVREYRLQKLGLTTLPIRERDEEGSLMQRDGILPPYSHIARSVPGSGVYQVEKEREEQIIMLCFKMHKTMTVCGVG